MRFSKFSCSKETLFTVRSSTQHSNDEHPHHDGGSEPQQQQEQQADHHGYHKTTLRVERWAGGEETDLLNTENCLKLYCDILRHYMFKYHKII